MLITLLLALQDAAGEAAPAAPQGARPPGGAGFGMFDFFVIVPAFLLIFYFLMWRPQARERRNREAMFKALKKGDRVLLSCGLVGEIAAFSDQDVLVRYDDKDPRRLRFRRYAIQGVLGAEEAAAETATSETAGAKAPAK
jgi:preprotein translocase subunit YajC